MKGVIREVKAPKGPDEEIKDRLRLIIEDGKSRFEWYDEKFFNHIDVLLLRCFFLSDIINTGNIKKISGYGYSLDWLFIGVGEMRINDKEAPGSSKTEIPTRTTSFERLTEFNKEFKAASTHDPIRVVKHVLKIHPPKYKGEIIQEVIDSIEKELSKDYDSFITGLNPKY